LSIGASRQRLEFFVARRDAARLYTIWLLRRLGANTDTAGVPFNHLVGHREEGRRHVETCRTDSHLIQELSVA
jgi:hypothetical protein